MRQTSPSISMCMPFLNWFVLTTRPWRAECSRQPTVTSSLVKRVRISQPSSVTTTRSSMRIPPSPREVDARLDGDDVAGLEHVLGLGSERRRLVHLHPDAVAEPVAEPPGEPRRLDRRRAPRRPRHGRTRPRAPRRARACARARIRRTPRASRSGSSPGRERPRAVRAVAARRAPRSIDDRLAAPDRPVAGMRVRHRAVRRRRRRSRRSRARRRPPRGSARRCATRARARCGRRTAPRRAARSTRSRSRPPCGSGELVLVLDRPQRLDQRRAAGRARARPAAASRSRA